MKLPTKSIVFPAPGSVAYCACQDSYGDFLFRKQHYAGEFNGSITTRVGSPTANPDGYPVLPLIIIGYSTTSDIEGMGQTTLDFDFSTPVAPSSLTGQTQQSLFPGIQKMNLRILMTSEVFPGKTLRGKTLGSLVNGDAQAFPPPEGSVYTLQRAVELEDVERPGKALISLSGVNTQIISTNIAPEVINVGFGVQLYAMDGSFNNVLTEGVEETPVTFSIDKAGHVTIKLYDEHEEEVATVFDDEQPAGKNTVTFDTSKLEGAQYFYQLYIDGQARSALMLLISRQ